ncbi:MAG: phosphatase PAP2 family protein [Pseudomonadota bacterium]
MMDRLATRPVFTVFLACLALFILFPGIDPWFSGFFYTAEQGFYLADHPLVRGIYQVFARMGMVVALGLGGYWAWRRFRRRDTAGPWQRIILFLVAVLVLAPGLVINGAFKADSGRARPHQVEAFGGVRHFSAFGQPARECSRNCSFASGHAAMGFYFIAFAWLGRPRRWILAGLVMGALVGLGRIMQGGHFLSDVVFAFWATYFVAYFTAEFLLEPDSSGDVTVRD